MPNEDSHDTATLEEIDRVLCLQVPPAEVLRAVCRTLAERHDGYDWVGFYVVDPTNPTDLVLGPFVGAPTDHVRIPFGRGICGQAAEAGRTIVVGDVSAEDNYLACSLSVRSEIVLPVWADGRIIAELDLDSHAPDRFSPRDEALLTAVCSRVVPAVEAFRDIMGSPGPRPASQDECNGPGCCHSDP